jgi:hypothetical protein
MVKMMTKGMHFVTMIECNGRVTDTDASHVNGNAITLLDIDFERIMNNSEKLKELQVRQSGGFMDAKDILNEIEGIKIEMEREITVQFK